MFKGKPLKPNQIKIGKEFYISPSIAELIEAQYVMHSNPLSVPDGTYRVTKIDDDFINPPNTRRDAWVEMVLYAKHFTWTEQHPNEIQIVLNPDGDVIIAGELTIPACLINIVSDIRELVKQNETRFDCIACGEKLNIVTHNVRICNSCEKEDEEEISFYPDDEETLTGIPFC